MTNRSMVHHDKNAKNDGAEDGGIKAPSGKTNEPLADERHPHSAQLKPVIDEKRTGLQKPVDK